MTKYTLTEQFYFLVNGIEYAGSINPAMDISIHNTLEGAKAKRRLRALILKADNYHYVKTRTWLNSLYYERKNAKGNRVLLIITKHEVEE